MLADGRGGAGVPWKIFANQKEQSTGRKIEKQHPSTETKKGAESKNKEKKRERGIRGKT